MNSNVSTYNATVQSILFSPGHSLMFSFLFFFFLQLVIYLFIFNELRLKELGQEKGIQGNYVYFISINEIPGELSREKT